MKRDLFFDRYIGIDYSGAETPGSSLKGLRVYLAGRATLPVEVQPASSPRAHQKIGSCDAEFSWGLTETLSRSSAACR